MRIRLAQEKDAAALLEIYKQYIDTTITFEYELPSKEEFQRRIREYSKEYPYFICTENGRCVGYVYAHRAQERAAFQWNAELSIYLDKNYHGKGVGKVLYEMMFEILAKQGVKTLYGLVTTPNPKSVKLHERTGFQLAGTYHNTGFKANQWCDLLLYEKPIGEYAKKPTPMIPFCKMDRNELAAIIKKYEKMVQQ